LLHAWSWAIPSQVAWKTTRIAAVTSSASTYTESWTISLNVADALAVIALLGLCSAGHRALAGFVTGLLAWILSEEPE